MDWGKARLEEKREMSACWLIFKMICPPAYLSAWLQFYPSILSILRQPIYWSDQKTSRHHHHVLDSFFFSCLRFYMANVPIIIISLKQVPWLWKAYVITTKDLFHTSYTALWRKLQTEIPWRFFPLLNFPYLHGYVCVCVCMCVITHTVAEKSTFFSDPILAFNKGLMYSE